MRLRKWISCSIILIVTLLVFKQNVLGDTTINSGADVSNYPSIGGGGGCSDASFKYNGTDGIRLTVIMSDGTKLSSADFYSTPVYGNIPGHSGAKIIGKGCSKIEYLMKTCVARTNTLIYDEKMPQFLYKLNNTGMINHL